jgi:NitT/TauT family transport system ATP-binding protein
MMAVLTINRLSKSFRSRGMAVEAIRNLSLVVEEEEFVTVVGPSGCGKSTLLNLVVGLIEPTSGEILFQEQPVRVGNRMIGYVTQRDTLLPWRTLQQNVEFPLEVRKVDRATRAARARELIAQVGLAGFENHYPHELSGGMRQRAMIVRSLAYDPGVLLLDEPFGALDAQTRGQLQNQLMELQAATKKTMVFITHDLMEAIALADRVVVISRPPGTVRAEHPVSIPRPRNVFEIHNTPAFRDLFDTVKEEVLSEMTPMHGQQAVKGVS